MPQTSSTHSTLRAASPTSTTPFSPLWQKEADEAVGKNFFELDYPPDLAERLQRQIQEVIESKGRVSDETPFTSAFGTRYYEYIFVPVLGPDGEVEAVAGSTRDITERKASGRGDAEKGRTAPTARRNRDSHQLGPRRQLRPRRRDRGGPEPDRGPAGRDEHGLDSAPSPTPQRHLDRLESAL